MLCGRRGHPVEKPEYLEKISPTIDTEQVHDFAGDTSVSRTEILRSFPDDLLRDDEEPGRERISKQFAARLYDAFVLGFIPKAVKLVEASVKRAAARLGLIAVARQNANTHSKGGAAQDHGAKMAGKINSNAAASTATHTKNQTNHRLRVRRRHTFPETTQSRTHRTVTGVVSIAVQGFGVGTGHASTTHGTVVEPVFDREPIYDLTRPAVPGVFQLEEGAVISQCRHEIGDRNRRQGDNLHGRAILLFTRSFANRVKVSISNVNDDRRKR